MNTTRRYPRTLVEAFGEPGCIEHYTGHGLRALLSRWLQRSFH